MTLHRPMYCNPYANLLEVTLPHCTYLDIYISRKIRLCVVDLEGKFQTNLQAKLLNFLVWKFNLLYPFFFYFLQNLSNPVLFTHCCCYSKELTYLNCVLMQKSQSEFPDQKVDNFGL